MAYARRKKFTRRYRRGRKFAKRGKKSFVKKTVKRMLVSRGINRPEVKHMWRAPAAANIPNDVVSPPFANLLDYATMNQGPEDGEMIGREITARYLDIRMKFKNTGTNQHNVRCLLIKDLQYRGTPLRLYSTTGNQADLVFKFNSIISPVLQTGRFKILHDRQFLIGNGGPDPGGPSYIKLMRIFKRLGNVRIRYTEGALVVTGVNVAYYLFLVSDGAIVETEVNWKVGYTDV